MPPSSMLMGEVFQYSVANELVANGKRYILILLKGKSVLYLPHDKYIYTQQKHTHAHIFRKITCQVLRQILERCRVKAFPEVDRIHLCRAEPDFSPDSAVAQRQPRRVIPEQWDVNR